MRHPSMSAAARAIGALGHRLAALSRSLTWERRSAAPRTLPGALVFHATVRRPAIAQVRRRPRSRADAVRPAVGSSA